MSIRLSFLILSLFLLQSSSFLFSKNTPIASQIYHSGDILTLSSDSTPTYVQTLAVSEDGLILFAGKRSKVWKFVGKNTEWIDLHGKTLLPSFIDAHSHFASVGYHELFASLYPSPDGPADSFATLVQTVKAYSLKPQSQRAIEEIGWIVGFGYDDASLSEKQHPDKHVLDLINDTYPVLIWHMSGHSASMNSVGLRKFNFSEQVVKEYDESGKGTFMRYPGTNELTGVCLQFAFFDFAMPEIMNNIPFELRVYMMNQTQNRYFSYGITTAHDGRTSFLTSLEYIHIATQLQNGNQITKLKSVRKMKEEGKPLKELMIKEYIKSTPVVSSNPFFRLDVHIYPDYQSIKDYLPTFSPYLSKSYINNFRIAGAKLGLDGSIQMRTGWLHQSYYTQPEGYDAGFKGSPMLKDQQLKDAILDMRKGGWQTLAHVNGDQAINQYLTVLQEIQKQAKLSEIKSESDIQINEDKCQQESDDFECKNKKTTYSNLDSLRTVAIHSQMTTLADLDRMAALKVIPSFFGAHTFYWGDWHRQVTLGPVRAAAISPAKTAFDKKMIFTQHTDAPVVTVNPLKVLAAVTTRKTRSNFTLGASQILPVYPALLSLTKYPAYQCGQQKMKGTLQVGKYADLVILSENPLKIPVDNLRQIRVLTTIKRGKIMYELK